MKTKAILVIDEMPDICYKCPCYDHEGGICQASNSWKTDRENGCPLKPLPQKKEVEVNKIEDLMRAEFTVEDFYKDKYVAKIKLATDKMIALGWNACLEEIEK